MSPQLEILDPIDLSYHSYDISDQPLWDIVDWDDFNWAKEGENFDYDGKEFKMMSKSLNLDNFSLKIKAREL